MRRICLSMVFPAGIQSPIFAEQIHQFTRCHTVAIVRANIIIALVLRVFVLLLGDHQVDRQRFQHMLIRAGRIRIADADHLLCCHCTDAVWDDAVIGKITAADHIAGACR